MPSVNADGDVWSRNNAVQPTVQKENVMTSKLKGTFGRAVLVGALLFSVAAGVVWAAGRASVTRSPSGTTGFTGEGQTWPSLAAPGITGCEVNGSLSYTPPGPPLAGTASAAKGTDVSGSITNLPNRPDGTQAGQWKIYLKAQMRARVEADPYAAGTGGYTSKCTVALFLVKVDGTNQEWKDTAQIVNEAASSEKTVALEYGSTDPNDPTIKVPVVHNGNSVTFGYACGASNDISTSRPEATIKARGWMLEAFNGYAMAYDATDPAAPVLIVLDGSGNTITDTTAYYAMK
jgi:hypothetical protein